MYTAFPMLPLDSAGFASGVNFRQLWPFDDQMPKFFLAYIVSFEDRHNIVMFKLDIRKPARKKSVLGVYYTILMTFPVSHILTDLVIREPKPDQDEIRPGWCVEWHNQLGYTYILAFDSVKGFSFGEGSKIAVS